MNNNDHICSFESVTARWDSESEPALMVNGAGLFCGLLNLIIKIRIKMKKLLKAKVSKCKVCNQYKWECPYCNSESTIKKVPRFKKCDECKKTSFFEPYFYPYIPLFRNIKKP